jgi:hypothetical protein
MLRLANHYQFRVINVAIELEHANSMKYLANAMDLMPNLHTIQLMCHVDHFQESCGLSPGQMRIHADQFLQAFERHDYPSVKRALLPVQARSMLASLPAVVDVYMNSPSTHWQFAQFTTALAATCPVETLGWELGYGVSTAGVWMIFIAVPISYGVLQ